MIFNLGKWGNVPICRVRNQWNIFLRTFYGSYFTDGSPKLKTYSEFSRGRKLQRNLANLDTASANPGTCRFPLKAYDYSSVIKKEKKFEKYAYMTRKVALKYSRCLKGILIRKRVTQKILFSVRKTFSWKTPF